MASLNTFLMKHRVMFAYAAALALNADIDIANTQRQVLWVTVKRQPGDMPKERSWIITDASAVPYGRLNGIDIMQKILQDKEEVMRAQPDADGIAITIVQDEETMGIFHLCHGIASGRLPYERSGWKEVLMEHVNGST